MLPAPAPPAEIQVQKIQGNVFLLVGDGANILVQTGEQGVLLVDTGRTESSAKMLAAVQKLSEAPHPLDSQHRSGRGSRGRQ